MNDDTHGRILLAIDIQQGFINPHTRHIPHRVARLIDHANYQSVIATRFVNTASSPWVRLMHWHGMTTVGEQALHPLISERATRTFDKTTYSAATPDLLAMLRDTHCTGVDVCGLDTEACVLMTAATLFEHGIDVRVLTNLCASSMSLSAHRAGLTALRSLIGADRIIHSPIRSRTENTTEGLHS